MTQTTQESYQSWFSTYGLLTAERVLDYFKFEIDRTELAAAFKESRGVLYDVLKVPVKNIFNGIIFQQAYDYQVYVMKLMIDYRLSPEYAKEPDSPGQAIREELNENYDVLTEKCKKFVEDQQKHYELIAATQAYLIAKLTKAGYSLQELADLEDDEAFKDQIGEYSEQAQQLTQIFIAHRQWFYEIILWLTDRLKALSDYHFDIDKAFADRESLVFATEISTKSKE